MDIESTIQFIVNQQAQFVADIHSLQQSQRALADSVDKLHVIVTHHEDAHVVTYGMIEKLAGRVEDWVERQGWLFEGQKNLLQAQVRTDANVAELTKIVGGLANKMDHFIDEVRKAITGWNGGKQSDA